MAKQAQITVTCDICGKVIAPTVASIPTEYIWYDGTNICKECIAKGAINKKNEGELK